MTFAVDLAFALLALGGVFTAARLVLGPTVADRVVASDVLLSLFALSTMLLAARTGEGTFLEVGLVVALLGFVGTAAVARFLEASPAIDDPEPVDDEPAATGSGDPEAGEVGS